MVLVGNLSTGTAPVKAFPARLTNVRFCKPARSGTVPVNELPRRLSSCSADRSASSPATAPPTKSPVSASSVTHEKPAGQPATPTPHRTCAHDCVHGSLPGSQLISIE